MAPQGSVSQRQTGFETLERARARAALIPELLIEAKRVANTVYTGWHGRRKRGVGENFWQFRPYVPGENLSKIDWRRSARDEQHIYVQDKEWQATHTVWLWVDESPSMLFKSDAAMVSKQSRALVLAFAMAELLARSGERVGWLGVTNPILSRNSAEKLAEALLLSQPQMQIPTMANTGAHSDVILFSDFLDDQETTSKSLQALYKRGLTGHLVQVIDPVEESFPYQGRVEFSDPETGQKFIAGSADNFKQKYLNQFALRAEVLKQTTQKLGWDHFKHHTHNLASEALVQLHTLLKERRS